MSRGKAHLSLNSFLRDQLATVPWSGMPEPVQHVPEPKKCHFCLVRSVPVDSGSTTASPEVPKYNLHSVMRTAPAVNGGGTPPVLKLRGMSDGKLSCAQWGAVLVA